MAGAGGLDGWEVKIADFGVVLGDKEGGVLAEYLVPLIHSLRIGGRKIFYKNLIFCLHVRQMSCSFYINRTQEIIIWHDRKQTKSPNRLNSMLS